MDHLPSGGHVSGILGLMTEGLQDQIKIEEEPTSTIPNVRNPATASPGQDRVVTDIQPSGEVASINDQRRHREFLPAW
jgi:hypothetical protein